MIVIVKEIAGISKEARMFDTIGFKDKELQNALKKLVKEADIFILEDDFFRLVFDNLYMLPEIATAKDITPYNKEENGEKLAYDPDVLQIYAHSENAEELKFYWKEWFAKNSAWTTEHFGNYIEAFHKTAAVMEVPILEFWYKYYDYKTFMNEMEDVMNQIKPFYQQLHAYIRQQLIKKYGTDVIKPTGMIPHHLFQQVLLQTWKNCSVIEGPFGSRNIPQYDNFVMNKEIDAKKLYKLAEDFYQSIGFEGVTEEFWEKRAREKTEEEANTEDCSASVFDTTPKIFLEYCKKVNFRKLMQAHRNMGRLHFAKEKRNLPAYFFDSYELEYPVGEAVILSASTPNHLSAIGLASNFPFTDEILLNRLFRMGVHTMLTVPIYFVENKLMHDLLKGTVEMNGLNKHYWNLMEEYVGVEPPVDRPESVIDFPMKFFADLEHDRPTKDFVSEILGYQFYEALCKKSGQKGELNNCDFYGSKEVGKVLKEMITLGSTKPWRQVISKVLPENSSLNGNSLLEYYAPIQNWLQKKNQENSVKIGWNASERKVM